MEATLRKAKGHIWLAVAATLIVTVLPLVAVYTFQEATGVVSPWISGLLGAMFSVSLALTGAALWRKFGSNDLVFSDLLIWGYLRRVWIERRLLRVSLQVTSVLRDEVDLSREGRAAVLADFASVIEQSDPYLHGHSRRVARHSYMIAKMMRLPKSTVETIRTAAAIHDLGKMDVPKEILHKPGPLSDEEFAIMKRHSDRGAEIVRGILDDEVTAIVLHHHERLDGKGYPHGLSGDEIPLGARVIAVADTFDAVTSTRPYRKAARQKRGIEILKQEAGTQLDANAVHAFLRYYSGKKGFGWWGAAATMPQHVLETIFAWFRNATLAGAVQTAAAAVGSVAMVAGSGGLTIDASSATRPPASTVQAVSPPTPGPTPGPTPFPLAERAPVGAESTNSHGDSHATGDSATPTPSQEPAEVPSPRPTQSDPIEPSDPDEPTDVLQQVIEELLEFLPIPGP